MYVDDDDMPLVSQYKWRLAQSRTTPSVVSTRYSVDKVSLTRLMLNPPPDMVIDHIDGNVLNNSRSNLRVCTADNNSKNRRGSNHVRPRGRRWEARLTHNYANLYIGMFDTKEEALRAARVKKRELRGEYTPLDEDI